MKNKHNWVNHVFNFIAVILGVYLAFLINEKATINKEKKESAILMNSLLNDLSDDIKTYEEYQIPENTQQQEKIGKLLDLLVKDDLKKVEKEITSVLQIENFTPTTSTYNSMKFANNLRLIDDLALQKKLSNYYEGLAVESIKKGEFQVEYFKNEMLPWLTTNVDLMEMKLLKEDDLLPFRNKLIVYESIIEQKIHSYKLAVKSSKQLKLSIESKLK